MRTARSSSRRRGSPPVTHTLGPGLSLNQAPPRSGTPPGPGTPPRPGTPRTRPPRTRQPPGTRPPPCEQNYWHTLVKILPCCKLRLRVVTRMSCLMETHNIYRNRKKSRCNFFSECVTHLVFIVQVAQDRQSAAAAEFGWSQYDGCVGWGGNVQVPRIRIT